MTTQTYKGHEIIIYDSQEPEDRDFHRMSKGRSHPGKRYKVSIIITGSQRKSYFTDDPSGSFMSEVIHHAIDQLMATV